MPSEQPFKHDAAAGIIDSRSEEQSFCCSFPIRETQKRNPGAIPSTCTHVNDEN